MFGGWTVDWEVAKEYFHYVIFVGGLIFIAIGGVAVGYLLGRNYDAIESYIPITFFESTTLMPHDRINMSNIRVYENETCIDGTFSWSSYANTGSMRPTLGGGHNGLYIDIHNTTELYPGDVITFVRYDDDGNFSLIAHRIIKIGNDTEGWYAVTKGDNNEVSDGIVRWSQLQRVMVGIIY